MPRWVLFPSVDGLVLSDDWTRCFSSYGVLSSVCVPDSVRELCDGCFQGCQSLRRVTFGSSSSLERIGDYCFGGLRLVGFEAPPSVRHIGSIFSAGLDQIFVRAWNGKNITLECDLTDKIEDLTAKIRDEEGIQPQDQRLIFAGRQLEDGKTLLDYKIEPGNTVRLTWR